jgi:hypothetical protein
MFTVFPSRFVGIREIIGKSGEMFYSEFISESREILKQVQDETIIPALSRNCDIQLTVKNLQGTIFSFLIVHYSLLIEISQETCRR